MKAARASHLKLPGEAMVLTKAVIKAAELLDVTNAALARVLGLSPSTVSRLRQGQYVLKADAKEFELAVLFVRLFRSLDAISGSDDTASKSWLRAENRLLRGRPIDRIRTVTGLIDVVGYLDARRAPI
jgi:hypothetical protein